MSNVFSQELFRSIRSSLARFLAIFGIVALGCGFYAGLRMTGIDMRRAADTFYDGTNLYDIRVVSTLGLSDEQLDYLRGIDRVDQVMADYALDVMATVDDEQSVFRISSLDVGKAKVSVAFDNGHAVEGSAGYLNRLVLEDGRWPEKADECVASSMRQGARVVDIGQEIEVLYGTSDLDGVLTTRTFKIVGLVNSSSYVSNATISYTSLGSGIVQQFIYVPEASFDADLPYTEANLTVRGAKDPIYGSDAYWEIVDEVKKSLEQASGEIASMRLAEIKRDAQDALDEERDEFEKTKEDAESELDDAKSELDRALAELRGAEAQIASGQRDYDSGVSELNAAKRKAESEIENATKQLDDAEAQLGMSQADIDKARADAAAGQAELDAAKSEWESTRANLEDAQQNLSQLSSAISALTSFSPNGIPTQDQLNALKSSVASGISAAGNLSASSVEGMASIGGSAGSALQGVAQLLDSIDLSADPVTIAAQLAALDTSALALAVQGISQAQSQVASGIAEGDAKVSSAQAELDAAAAQLDEAQAARDAIDAGRAELATKKAEADKQIADAQAKLDKAAADLASGRAQLESGRREYEDGLATYTKERTRADGEFADAASQIATAQADIDSLEAPDVYILDREDSPSIVSYQDDSERIDHIAEVFPLIFFLVAALVALTTMTRMVEEERVEIGTHKALGFSRTAITSKYLGYASIAGGVGAIVGIALLSQILPYVVMVAYAIMYTIPLPDLPLRIDPALSVLAIVAGLGITLLATYAAAAATLRETPAALMLPKAPKAGKRILLEHIGPVWRRVSFTWKVTLRNLFRYKRRLAMTVIGIAGCTALLLTGLGLHDSIWDIIDNQFEGEDPIILYNIEIGLEKGATATGEHEAAKLLAGGGEPVPAAMADVNNMQISSAAHPETMAVSIMIPENVDDFGALTVMRDRHTKEAIPFTGTSVIITEKTATMLGVGVGDTVRIFDQDDIGNAVGSGYAFTITDVVENYVRHYLYIGEDAWHQTVGEAPIPDTIFAQVDIAASDPQKISADLHEIEDVSTVAFNHEIIETYRKSLSSVNMIVVVLVVAAAALAFIVLYNLTNINIVERTREIASLKVLGFTRTEVAQYVFREVMLLVVLGAALGLAFGGVFEHFVVLSSEVDIVMFGREIHAISYVLAVALTLGFAVLVMCAMLPKLRRINMVESLKSVD